MAQKGDNRVMVMANGGLDLQQYSPLVGWWDLSTVQFGGVADLGVTSKLFWGVDIYELDWVYQTGTNSDTLRLVMDEYEAQAGKAVDLQEE